MVSGKRGRSAPDYDRSDAGTADTPNQAINHGATAMLAAAAVASLAAIPQLGFVQEDSGQAFVLVWFPRRGVRWATRVSRLL